MKLGLALSGGGALFAILVIAYLILKKKMESSEVRQIQKLREGTQAKKHTSEILYQKLYVRYIRIPFLKRYLLKIRRKTVKELIAPSGIDASHIDHLEIIASVKRYARSFFISALPRMCTFPIYIISICCYNSFCF